MKVDPRLYMSLSTNPEQPEKGIDRSQTKTMVLSEEHELPVKVANVSRDELRRYAQCKRIGNYLLGRTVGEGSFAKVKEAIHILTGEKVAIKIIDKNRARKDRYVSKNMRREARLLQMIRHPHIVQLLEIVETSQCYYLVFEFADGGDLMDHICKRKKLEEDEVRKFIRQIISAVEYLHRLGIMHRDLKVENLLLDANHNIKIIDFGLSNTTYSPDPNNENHCTTQCGSPAYAAPELLVRKDYGPQIDVWSIGVNMYAMLTGRLPYTVEPFNITALYNKMLRRQMNPIPEYLSEACKDMIHQLLNPDPKERLHILDAVGHRWVTMDQKDPLSLISCPNYLCEEDLDDRILDHVEEQLKLNSDDVIRDVIQNKATKNSCVYHLLVRRLERYKREQRKFINTSPPTIQLTEPKQPSSPEHKPPSPNHHATTHRNGLVRHSSPKTHIMENPFKTIKVALIRQKKAVKNEEKSKSGKTTNEENSACSSTANSEAAPKPKLCAVKRVALVKFSPARRSLRGLTSSSRNHANSPKPGRRKSYFEGLQQRRKSPKVRRRHVELDDSRSSTASTPRRTSVDNTDNIEHTTQRKRIEDKMNNNTAETNGNLQTLLDTTSDGDPGTNTSETVAHLYTDKGVVLKRGEDNKTNGKQEQASVQHHVFPEEDKTVTIGSIEDKQGCQRINGEKSNQGTSENGLLNAKVVNAKISSVPSKVTAKPTSQRLSTSTIPVSRQTPRAQALKAKTTPLKQPAQKAVIPRRTHYKLDNPSKIPVMTGKNSSISYQSTLSPTRLAPRTLQASTVNSRLPGTVAKKTDVARLADKYDKCVSVNVVGRSTEVEKNSLIEGKSSREAGKDLASTGNQNVKGTIQKNERISAMNNSKNRNVLAEAAKVDRSVASKVSTPTGKDETVKKGTNLKSGGDEQKTVEGKEIKQKTIGRIAERLQNGMLKQKVEDQLKTKPSLVKSAKESLHASKTASIVKDTKQAVENARKNSINNRAGKVSTLGNTRGSSIKTPEKEDLKSWTGDERRKISNYKKTNDAQKTSSVVKRDTKTVQSVRNPTFKTR